MKMKKATPAVLSQNSRMYLKRDLFNQGYDTKQNGYGVADGFKAGDDGLAVFIKTAAEGEPAETDAPRRLIKKFD
jgi:hypothetical protein